MRTKRTQVSSSGGETQRFSNGVPSPAVLEADPESLDIDLRRTAVLVIDMQNAFLSKGGMFALPATDFSVPESVDDPSEKVSTIRRIVGSARTKGIRIAYTATVSSPTDDLGPDSPYWKKSVSTLLGREHPQWRDKLLFPGTWGADIIEGLKPKRADLFVQKPRYSAFFQTNLDSVLRTNNLKYLIFVGVATNICVEATIRDAYYLEYYPILVSDASINSGPSFTQEATIFNVKACYGWVTEASAILNAFDSL